MVKKELIALPTFIKKRGTSILFTNTILNRLGFGGTASGDFNFRNNESEDTKAIPLSMSSSVPMSTHVNTFVGFTLKNLRTEI